MVWADAGVVGRNAAAVAGAVSAGGVFFHAEANVGSFAFCAFFFFENWLYTATYMADARAMVLPLVTTGDPDHVEHDWNTIFSSLGVLQYDTTIAGIDSFSGMVRDDREWWSGLCGEDGRRSQAKPQV